MNTSEIKTSVSPLLMLMVTAFVITVIVLLSGCSTARVRILPGEGGIHRAISRDIEGEGAQEAAVDKARDYCKDQGKEMYVVNEDATQYKGEMDEKTRNTVRGLSKAAILMSGPTGIITRSSGMGAVMGGAGVVGASMTNGRDYESQLKFKCGAGPTVTKSDAGKST